MVEWLIWCHERLIKWEHSTNENKSTRINRVEEESSQTRAMEKFLNEWNTVITRGDRSAEQEMTPVGPSTPVEWRRELRCLWQPSNSSAWSWQGLKVHKWERVWEEGDSQEVYTEAYTSISSVYKTGGPFFWEYMSFLKRVKVEYVTVKVEYVTPEPDWPDIKFSSVSYKLCDLEQFP